MAEVNDIRSLLTAKSRAKVAPRDTSLSPRRSPTTVDVPATIEDRPAQPAAPATDPSQDNTPEPLPSPPAEESALSTNPPLPLQSELDNLPTMGKRLAVHLEEGVRSQLLQWCDRQDLTPETFFEAAFVFLQARPDLLTPIADDAKGRLAQRKRAGLVRRTASLMQKYSS